MNPKPKTADEALGRLKIPKELPSIVDIKSNIPDHCFEPDFMTSLYYMLKDFFFIGLLYHMSEWSWMNLPHEYQAVLTPLYWYVQGTFFWAMFMIGHDCDHNAFATSEFVNDVFGNIAHTFLGVPYYMWKVSHRHHHKNTANIDREEIYYPMRRSQVEHWYNEFTIPYFGFGLAWWIYLIRGYNPRNVYHFNILDPMFRPHALQCSISLACFAAWAYTLYLYALNYSWGALVYHWVVPDFVFASYQVVTTFLHHNEKDAPWYSDEVWTYVRGQLTTVDRDYGWCHHLIHHIGTHQIHHLFPKIPQYHLEEATAHWRNNYPHLVQKRPDPILPAFFRNFNMWAKQSIIDDDTIIHLYT